MAFESQREFSKQTFFELQLWLLPLSGFLQALVWPASLVSQFLKKYQSLSTPSLYWLVMFLCRALTLTLWSVHFCPFCELKIDSFTICGRWKYSCINFEVS